MPEYWCWQVYSDAPCHCLPLRGRHGGYCEAESGWKLLGRGLDCRSRFVVVCERDAGCYPYMDQWRCQRGVGCRCCPCRMTREYCVMLRRAISIIARSDTYRNGIRLHCLYGGESLSPITSCAMHTAQRCHRWVPESGLSVAKSGNQPNLNWRPLILGHRCNTGIRVVSFD